MPRLIVAAFLLVLVSRFIRNEKMKREPHRGRQTRALQPAPMARLEGSLGQARSARSPGTFNNKNVRPEGPTETLRRACLSPLRGSRAFFERSRGGVLATLRTCPWLPSGRAFGVTYRRLKRRNSTTTTRRIPRVPGQINHPRPLL